MVDIKDVELTLLPSYVQEESRLDENVNGKSPVATNPSSKEQTPSPQGKPCFQLKHNVTQNWPLFSISKMNLTTHLYVYANDEEQRYQAKKRESY